MCVRRELGPAVVPNLVALWNLKIDSYFSFAEDARGTPARVIFIRSEDLVLDQVRVLRRLAEWLGVAPPDGIAEIRRHVTKGRRRLDDLKSYYGEEAWRSELGEEALAFVAGEARADLLKRAGYDPISLSPVAA